MRHNKKITTFLILVGLTIASGCGMEDDRATMVERQKEADIMTVAHINGCPRCHRVKTSVVGPAWELISDRYKDAEVSGAKVYLMDKVMSGGDGNWNDITGGAKMPPHRGLVSEEHLERLVDYILALKR